MSKIEHSPYLNTHSTSTPGTPSATPTISLSSATTPTTTPPSSSRARVRSVGPKNASLPPQPKDSPRTKELKSFLNNLKMPETPDQVVSQFYQVVMQLSHITQEPTSPELKFLAARLFQVINLKDPKTFTLFQLDGHSAKWPTWVKAHKLCKYLRKFGVMEFIDSTTSNIDLTIKAITFIHDSKKNKIAPADHLEMYKCISEEKFKKLLKETLDLTVQWKEEELKSLIESYLIENGINTTNQAFYSTLARTFCLTRLSAALKANKDPSSSQEPENSQGQVLETTLLSQ